MMSNLRLTHIIRFVSLVLIQVLILQGIRLGDGVLHHVNFIIYPLFIIMLPHNTPKWALVLLGFTLGLSVDLFYGTVGVHASAGTFIGWIRPIVLSFLAPKGGYVETHSPNRYRMGFSSYMQYASIMMALHLIFYFSMDYFSVVFFQEIAIRTLLSLPVSLLMIVVHSLLMNPKN